jgi:hypothetical protein
MTTRKLRDESTQYRTDHQMAIDRVALNVTGSQAETNHKMREVHVMDHLVYGN